jgi:hypothetical protein
MFSQIYHVELEDDRAVVHHELGHAFAWLSEGELVDEIVFRRAHDDLLEALMRQGRPPLSEGETQENLLNRMWTEKRNQLARRFLAGEVAARKLLDLPADEIMCDFPITRDSDLLSVLPNCERGSSDIVKALHIAHEAAGDGWHDWIAVRHAETRRQIGVLWECLSAFASEIVTRLPAQPSRELVITKTEIITAFSACNTTSP